MMTLEQLIERLLVVGGDEGCEQCFEHLGQLAEGATRVSLAASAAAAHVRSCWACREDADGLSALIKAEISNGRES
jgi:hypothetical protein